MIFIKNLITNMTILDQLKDFDDTALNTWYDLNIEESEDFIEALANYASSHQEEVKNFVLQLEVKKYSCLTILYEALFKKLDVWGAFIVTEMERLFQLVKTNQVEANILGQIDLLSCEEFENNQEILVQVLNNLYRHLNDTRYEIRYYAINLLSDCLCFFDYDQKDPKYIKGLQARLEDDHWKVRIRALRALKIFEKIPSGYKLSFLDKFRKAFGGSYV